MAHLVGSIVSMFAVDKLGRKPLLIVSQVGVILTWITFVICIALTEKGFETAKYGSAACLPMFMLFYSVGSASVPWILSSELFVQEARGTAASLVSAIVWISVFLVTFLFPIIVVVAKHFTFLIFVGILLLATIFILWKLPETKGKRLEDIQVQLKNA